MNNTVYESNSCAAMTRTATTKLTMRKKVAESASANTPQCSSLHIYIPVLTFNNLCKASEYSDALYVDKNAYLIRCQSRSDFKNGYKNRTKRRSTSLLSTAAFVTMTIFALIQPCFSIVNFFSKDDLKFTFGVNHHKEVPPFKHIYPQVIYSVDRSKLVKIGFELNGGEEWLDLEPATADLFADRYTVVQRKFDHGGGSLHVSSADSENNRMDYVRFDDCHYQHMSNRTYAAVSHCDESIKGVIVREDDIYVIHPIPNRHSSRMKRSADNAPLHVIYKRSIEQQDFCGIENTITSEELNDDESGVIEDVFVVGQKLQQDSELTVELGVFVDETLWRQFSSKHGTAAWQKLQQYSVTMLNNIQIMYKQPTAIPRLVFRIVRYEVFMAQPSALASHLHDYGHAQKYLDMFCRYQRSLGIRDWDHAILLTGYDIHRGSGSRSISGIARLDGMCDPWNTCTLAEGLDFTAAFIGTHELGHSVGMRHDEPYCQSRFIMSASLGPGKVTWSTCSLRDYHTFLQRLDSKAKNCLRTSLLREKIPIENSLKPGQIYGAHHQCTLMHGAGYMQVSPRQDHYDGICYMMWCGQGAFGRIITSHPALEGTSCGQSKWCELGRCVPWTGFSALLPLVPAISALPPTQPPTLPPFMQPATTTAAVRLQPPLPSPPPQTPQTPQSAQTDGQWSAWSLPNCQQCFCPPIAGSVGVALSSRACNAPAPLNGGAECEGSAQRAAVCSKRCPNDSENVNHFISRKCAEHKRIKSDNELTGTGSQLSRYPQRACKVFCDVVTKTVEKNYRFYGDNLPDGTACGWNRYCVGGECMDLSCDESTLLPRDVGCPYPSDRCPLTGTEAARREPLRGQWGTWSLWSSCTVSCGAGGYQIRSRTCSISNGCEGSPTERNVCNTQPCPPPPRNTEPQWTDWTPWNQCSVSCGRGSQARYRRCQTPQLTIAFSCPGQTMDIRDCDELPCVPPAPSKSGVGEWANWGAWSACSTTCGPGTQIRNRECKKEPCDGSGQQRLACNLRECVSWSDWGNWTECSRLCGKGIRSRSRLCPSGGVCSGSSIDQGFCNEQPCTPATAQVGAWNSWSAWSACSLTCGAGVKRRTRHCHGGNCLGALRESAICNEVTCSVSDANWGGWGYWSSCSETCGNGIRRRVRKCYGSGNCYGNEYERENCNTRAC